MRRRLFVAATCLFMTAATRPAIAQSGPSPAPAPARDPAAAQTLFEAALALMKTGNYREACPKLEDSQALDPGVGTQFRLAECYERSGRVARAWALYLDVAEATKREGNAKREKQARQRAEAVKPRVPLLTVHVAAATVTLADLEITRDGAPLRAAQWDLAIAVDPGPITLVAKARGKRVWEKTVTLAEGGSAEVSIPVLEDAPAAAAAPAAAPKAPTEPGSTGLAYSLQGFGAMAAFAGGAAGIAVGTIFGLRAKSTWGEALTHCAGDPKRCGSKGIELGGDASTQATISTIGFIAGGVLAAGGAVLLLTRKKPGEAHGLWVAPSVGATTGLTIGGDL